MSDVFKAMMELESISSSEYKKERSIISPTNFSAAPKLHWDSQSHEIFKTSSYPLNIVALAGTGKTELLMEFARCHDRMKWRYLAFNKSLLESMNSKFPPNVRGKTFHAIAYARFAEPFKKKLHINFNLQAVRRLVGWSEFEGWEIAVTALRQWRKEFMASASELPALGQLPLEYWKWIHSHPHILNEIGGPDGFVRAAEKLWSGTIDPRQETINTPLDAPLKLMCLADFKWGTHGVLVDESQDLSACLIYALQKQKIPVVMVGDPSQNLYEWRVGKGNWNPENRFNLTGSWRFGSEVADKANHFLKALGRTEFLEGKKENSSFKASGIVWKENLTWISRTQAGAMEGAISALKAGYRPSWVGQGTLDRISALMDLSQHRSSLNPWLSGLKSLDEVQKMAEESGSLEWKSSLKLLRSMSTEKLKEVLSVLNQPNRGNVQVTTVHQAKGKTFEETYLHTDLKWDSNLSEEMRINYVGLTRSAHVQIEQESLEKFTPTSKIEVENGNLSDDGF